MKDMSAILSRLVLFVLAALIVGCSEMKSDLGQGQERIDQNEPAITADLITVMQSVSRQRIRDGVIRRFNQPKTLGCFDAEFVVPQQDDPVLAKGLFGLPGTYPTRVRFANATKWDDRKKDFRGMSLKVMNIPDDVLFGKPGEQDFILNSHPVLFAGTPEQFLAFAEATEAGRLWAYFGKPGNWKSLWIALRGRGKSDNPFAERFWSTTPYRFGADSDIAVKYSLVPCGGAPEIAKEDHADMLAAAMAQHLRQGDACFDFKVQFQADPDSMPIEDASIAWDESESPFRTVATLRIADQDFRSAKAMNDCEAISFNPWQSLEDHRPLGGINRVRKESYAALAAYRGARVPNQGGRNEQDH